MSIVIAGASLAGVNAAETLRSEGYDGKILMIGAEPDLPYERPPLSKGYLLGNDELESAFVHPADWYAAQNIEVRLSTRVTAIDSAAKTVTTDDGSHVDYAKLLLATGSTPRRLDLSGNVFYLRDIRDSQRLREALKLGAHVAVIGAGWIGLEVASAARKHGCQVTVIEIDSLPLRRVLGDEVATVFRDLHSSHGVTFHFGRSVTGSADNSLTLDDGTLVPADVIVVGVGVSPSTELASAAGLAVDNGVLVDAALRTSAPDIFACGDIAHWENPLLGTRIRVEHWENARQSGIAAARSMLGQEVSYDWLPYFFSDQYDAGMEYSGWTGDGYDAVVFRGEPQSREFIAFWLRESRVLAAMNLNVWDVQDDLRALITACYRGRTVDRALLADAGTALGEL
jgi:3-phenylpropionate/trans-cinnamate dioxygenase ferredoxin reductase subunit